MSIEELYSIFTNHPSICTDTRKIIPGSIFFALSGPSFNGNTFAQTALNGGCALAVIDDPEYHGKNCILVHNTLLVLQQLARYHRRQLNAKIIGITGSNGKTTSKELLRDVLSAKYRTYATSGNLNNHIGVPLTLLSVPINAEFVVVEMGASHQGDIRELCEIAEPDFGLITNIGKAHLEGMGGIEGVIKTKTELYEFIKLNNGKVFINTMHNVFIEKSVGIDRIRFGESDSDDYQGDFIESEPFVKFRWKSGKDPVNLIQKPIVSTRLIGKYNFENLLAAAAVGSYFRVEDEKINAALSEYVPDNNRSQILETANYHIILDAYNANPTSMQAALENFSAMHVEPKTVILGQMNEIGTDSSIEHQNLISRALELNFDQILLVGKPYLPVPGDAKIHFFESTDELLASVKLLLPDKGGILIKGSRSNKLELLKDVLVD
ncbi:MAG: UDP-N-acetylmuramoyl-tripeptide--D-alanyl-D-alanine ligase [Bacteroidia bacterium]